MTVAWVVMTARGILQGPRQATAVTISSDR
jgi:hypothetical protein